MATGKVRSNKRSSGGSYVSTVTTVVFVCICVLGLWMLTSSSYVSPNKSTTRVSDESSSTSQVRSRKIPTDSPAFEDNPGVLPEDAIQPDDGSAARIDPSSGPNETKQQVESTSNVVEGNDEIVNRKETKQRDQQVEEERKQKAEENQLSEESTMTQNQRIEEIPIVQNTSANEDHHRRRNDRQEKKTDQQIFATGNKWGMENNKEQHTVEEEQVKKTDFQTYATGGNDKWNMANNEEHHVTEEEQETSKKNDLHTYATGGNDKWNMVNNEEHPLTEQEEEARKKNNLQTDTTGGNDNWNMAKKEEHHIAEQEQEKRKKNSLETYATGGSDKWNMVNNDDHHITEEEQEKRMEKHQEQQQQSQNEETSKDQTPHYEDKPTVSRPANKIKAPMDEVKIETISTTPNKDSKMAAGNTMMAVESSSGIPKESKESKKGWKTQAGQSDNEKERRQDRSNIAGAAADYKWELCNVTTGKDYVPCLDNEKAIKKLPTKGHFEHRERHCPEEGPMCLVPTPEGYKTPIPWPQSRDKVWFHNVPHKSLADVKGHQNWVKVTGEFLTFPGGGTQFVHGALHYIDMLQQAMPEIAWGKHTRVILDVGCGVASFGGYLFDRNVLAMSFAPNDEHEAQIQFALERGIPAVSAVMGTQRLPFPSKVFDLVHCARCRVPWHIEGGMLLLEINRLLRPGGYFIWSATPIYRKLEDDVQIWKEMSALTVAMCWELVTIKKDTLNSIGVAIYRKPDSNECYSERKKQEPPMCRPDDDPNAAWYIPLQACMHSNPLADTERGSRWPEEWPGRVQTPPYWLNKTQMGIYGKPAPDDFKTDYEHWKRVVSKSYMSGLGFNWTDVRNVMDMRAVYGGFAAALKDLKLWVLNVVSTNSPDTLPIIFERGLFGMYHDWCESFSTYPRTYDLLHADHLFSMLKKRCKIAPVMVEVDRIVRPGGKLIVRDESSTIVEVENLLKSLHWDVHITFSKNQEGILSAQKSSWRPDTYAISS